MALPEQKEREGTMEVIKDITFVRRVEWSAEA